MSAGPISGGEVEQPEPGEEFISLGIITLLEMRFRNFELSGLGEHLIIGEATF